MSLGRAQHVPTYYISILFPKEQVPVACSPALLRISRGILLIWSHQIAGHDSKETETYSSSRLAESICGNVYAVFYKDYYDDFTCALIARDGVFWNMIAEPLYPSDPFDEENKRLVYERNGEKYWLDYGSIWYPNSDFRVTLDGVPMNFIKIDKTWSVYCMSGRAEGPEYENKPFLHVLLPYGREF